MGADHQKMTLRQSRSDRLCADRPLWDCLFFTETVIFMKHNIILPIILALLATGAAGCTKSLSGLDVDPAATQNAIADLQLEGFSEDAVHQGRIVVKVKGDALDDFQLVGPGRSVLMSSIPTALQSTLASIGASSIKPLFYDNPEYKEARHKYGMDRWMVITFDDRNTVQTALSKLSGFQEFEVVEPSYKTEVISGPSAPMTLAESDLAAVSRDAETPFDDTYLDRQWHYYNRGRESVTGGVPGADINLFEAWETQSGKSNVTVCVVDGGVDYMHEDLAAHVDLDRSFCFVLNPETGKYKGDEGTPVYPDDQGHGTHVAGTISAVNNNAIGVAGVAGGDGSEGSGVTIISAQCYGVGTETGSNEDAIMWGAEHGAVISQNSWGYVKKANLKEIPGSIKAAIDYFIAIAGKDPKTEAQLPDSPMAGGLVIFAAGNESFDGPSFPAAYEPCVAVTAMNNNFTLAGYSNYGSYADIMAPGGGSGSTGVLSTLPESINPQKYGYMMGTSMATPHVSGVAALIVSEFGRQGYTAEEARAQLLRSLSPYDIYVYNNAAGYAGKLGKGLVDAAAALMTDPGVGPDKPVLTVSNPQYYQADAAFKAVANPNSGRPDDLAHHYSIFISDKAGATVEDLLATEPVVTKFGNNLDVGTEFTHTLINLKDDTEYSAIVVAYDTFNNGTPSDIVTFKTPLNNPPAITSGLPEGTLTLLSIEEQNLLLPVTDADGHTWTHSISGDTKGVSVVREGEQLKVNIQPVQTEEGEYSFDIVLTDQFGKSSTYTIVYRLVKYFPPKYNSNLTDITIGVGDGTVRIPLDGKIDYVEGLPLSLTAESGNTNLFDATIDGTDLVLTPKMKGRANASLTVNDGRNQASKKVKVTVVNDTEAGVMLVYPMPATNKINALLNPDVTEAVVRVTSVRGEVLIEKTVTPSATHVATVDITSLSAGTYILVVRTHGNEISKTNFIKI